MFEWFIKNLSQDKRGFTLIELVVVIAILAILALIAVPRFVGTTDKAAVSAHNANVRTLESAANMLIAEKGNPSTEVIWKDNDESKDNEYGWGKYIQEWPTVPGGIEGKYKVTITTEGKIIVTPPKKQDNK